MEVQVKYLLHRYSIHMSEWIEMEKMQAECVKPSQSVVEQGKSECCSMSSMIRQSNTD